MFVEPVYPADFPLCQLGTAESLLITTTRLFLFVPETEQPWWEGLWRATHHFPAVTACERFLRVMMMASNRALDMRCPCSHELGADEGRLLQIIALYQHRRPEAALALLGEWLPPAASRIASVPISDLAGMLARHRLVVPWRCPKLETDFAASAYGDPGLLLFQ